MHGCDEDEPNPAALPPLGPQLCAACGLRWTGRATDTCPSDRCPTRGSAATEEAHNRAARNLLGAVLDRSDGEHSTSLAACARRAAEILATHHIPARDHVTDEAFQQAADALQSQPPANEVTLVAGTGTGTGTGTGALLAEIARDDKRWPAPPWEPDIDDPGTVAEEFTGKWETGAWTIDLSTVDRAEFARYIARLRAREPRLVAELAADRDRTARIAALELALRDLIARVERTGGYADGDDQDTLRRARQALVGGAR